MALKKFNFNVNHTENHSRVGVIETHRGDINTLEAKLYWETPIT